LTTAPQQAPVATPAGTAPDVRLVCIDIDGTLVGSSGVVHPSIWDAAARVRDAGIRLAVCSGRPALGVALDYAAQLDASGWHSFQNGASVLHLATGETRSQYLPVGAVTALVERARSSAYMLELYTDTAYAIESTGGRAREHAALLGVPFAPRRFEALQGPVVRAQWMVSRSDVDAVLAMPSFGLEVATSTSPVMPDTVFVGMTPPGVNKAVAVRAIAAEYGIALSHVMFVGDGGNDVAAMKSVGTAVAMANAEPEVREIAAHVAGHVDDAGLVSALTLAIARQPARA
jgi:Cof subfamily protein (haloacid dehalogenase superfamily)